jgi:hypothetical protein
MKKIWGMLEVAPISFVRHKDCTYFCLFYWTRSIKKQMKGGRRMSCDTGGNNFSI